MYRIALDVRFLEPSRVHPHSRLVHVFLLRNKQCIYPSEIVLLTHSDEHAFYIKSEYGAKNITVEALGHSEGRQGRFCWLFFAVPRFLYTRSVDVFYSSFYFLPLFSGGTALVNTIHDCCVFYIPPSMNRGALSKPYYLKTLWMMFVWTNLRSDRLVTVSNFSKDKICRHLFVPSNLVRVCYHGIENRLVGAGVRTGFKLSDSAEYLLFVGSNLPKKNIAQCMRGYALLPETLRLRYKFVFRTHPYPEDIRLASELCITDSVVFLDRHLTDSEMVALYASARLLVLLSHDEGFGLPIIEAYSVGVPVLVSSVSACGEIVSNPASKADPYSTLEVSQKMNALLDDEATRSSCLLSQSSDFHRFEIGRSADRFNSVLTGFASGHVFI